MNTATDTYYLNGRKGAKYVEYEGSYAFYMVQVSAPSVGTDGYAVYEQGDLGGWHYLDAYDTHHAAMDAVKRYDEALAEEYA